MNGGDIGGDIDQAPVPPRLRKLWRLPTSSRLGRPARLTLDQVVSTALVLADSDGLAGVTLPKVARRLGVTDMALYRHVESKDELLVLLRDAGLGDPPAPATAASWRPGLRAWALGQWTAYRARPWLAQVPISGPPAGPHEIAWMEAALAILAPVALTWAERLQVLGLLGGYVRSTVLLDQELAAGAPANGAEREYGHALSALLDPARFPHMAQLAASGLFTASAGAQHGPTDDEREFARGLEVILDGVAAMVDRAG